MKWEWARKTDATCTNKWKWSWLKEKDESGNYLSTYVRKINASGSAFCKHLIYDNAGKEDLLKHATKSTEHLSSKKNHLSTNFLPLHWRKITSDLSSEIRTCTPKARVYNTLWWSRKCPHRWYMPFIETEHFASYSYCLRS